MASAQRAYSESYSGFARSAAAPSRAQRRTDGNAARSIERGGRERSLRVERTGSHGERQSSLLMTAAIMAAIVLVVIAALSFARISLMNATVTTLLEADALSGQIETARSEGVSLEMEQSVLSNTYAINAAAKQHPGVLGTHGVYFDDEKKLLSFDVLVDFTVHDKPALCEAIRAELAAPFPGYTIVVNCDTNYKD